MGDEADLARLVVGCWVHPYDDLADNESGIIAEEVELVMQSVPDDIVLSTSEHDLDRLKFLRDYVDRSILFWRVMQGDIKRPMAGSGMVQ